MALQSLRLIDFSDRELLHIVNDNADIEGWAHVKEIARACGLEGERATRCVGARFAWLKRYGVVEHEESSRHRWRLTPIGEVLMRGQLRKSDEAALERLDTPQMLLVTRWLAQRQRAEGPETSKLMKREWVHSTYNGRG